VADTDTDEAPAIEGGTVQVTGFLTYAGEGFASVRTELSTGEEPTPPAVSNRAYLRNGLPAIYRDERDGDFGMRYIGALENVLDPIVAIIDGMPAHFDPGLAPLDILDLITAWLGIEYDESLPVKQMRKLVQNAAELGRRRGTRAGLEMALELNFPDLPLRIEDQGSVTWSTDPTAAVEAKPPAFVVYCDQAIPEARQASIARLIEEVKPVHVHYRLRVKAPKKPKPPES
jgi:phage tail-like protein